MTTKRKYTAAGAVVWVALGIATAAVVVTTQTHSPSTQEAK